jgi:hypothetical protein
MAKRMKDGVELIKTLTGKGRGGSRPKPPKAVVRSASLGAGHAQRSGGESPLCNLMEVKRKGGTARDRLKEAWNEIAT